jgi:hypothetical protein
MTRRKAIGATVVLAAGPASGATAHLEIPLVRITDKYARTNPAKRAQFLTEIWKEAEQVFARAGMSLRAVDRVGEILQYPSGRPRFRCLERGMINMVLADRAPLDWDKGRSLAGVSALYERFCICVISMNEAHGNQIPFISVSTVVHELLHVLLQDVFRDRTSVFHGQTSEARVDLHATRLWLFGSDETVRESAGVCLKRLRSMPRDTSYDASCGPA